MTKCQVCGEEVTDSKFCPNCGSVIESQPKEEVVEVNQEEAPSSFQSNNTKFCTNCGTEVDVNAVACTNCGAALSDLPNAQNPSKKFCTNCGSEIDINAIVCPKCGVSTGSKLVTEQKSSAVGIILNFFIPGLGHIVCDFTHRGANFLVMYVISIVLAFLIIGFILIPIVWIWSMIDVNTCVKKANAGEYVDEKIIF